MRTNNKAPYGLKGIGVGMEVRWCALCQEYRDRDEFDLDGHCGGCRVPARTHRHRHTQTHIDTPKSCPTPVSLVLSDSYYPFADRFPVRGRICFTDKDRIDFARIVLSVVARQPMGATMAELCDSMPEFTEFAIKQAIEYHRNVTRYIVMDGRRYRRVLGT